MSHLRVLAALAALASAPTYALPPELQYVQSGCSITPKEFNTWFESGHLAKNGMVKFADSLAFPSSPDDCDFYKWAHQMFLWITSPGPDGIVLDTPMFYDVNFDANGAYYVPNGPGAPGNRFMLRNTKPQNFQPGGQAGGGDTLLSLNDSLVYFGVHANDVYAWFNTAVSNGAIAGSAPFPTTQAELTAILDYAKSKGSTLKDGNALTLELKSAWVDASTVSNPGSYITISADVPNYVRSGDQVWKIDSNTPTVNKTLALVGLHVVGPVAGHPEMVWATFEHARNAPDNTFYFNAFGKPAVEVPYNSKGQWTFMSDGGSQSGALVAQMTVASDGSIQATAGNSIKHNDVYRVNPWGNAPTAASADNNSRLISLNFDIGILLGLAQDVRSNYLQIGAIWTSDGSIPPNGTDPKLAGSKLLANSTMETYRQVSPPSCFGCHGATSSTGTSHLFSASNKPLVPKQ
jgi:hypothetical protein